MTEAKARQIVLAARPQGKPQLTDFRLEATAIPTPSAGQVLLRVQYLSLDPYMRGLSRIPARGRCRHRRWPHPLSRGLGRGLERAPEAFIGMLEGRNFGKLIVRVDG